ncbi:MAG: hypothetical protein ACP5I1_15095, partial [Candidatus Hinthialibacter sp.]
MTTRLSNYLSRYKNASREPIIFLTLPLIYVVCAIESSEALIQRFIIVAFKKAPVSGLLTFGMIL